jgi:hypothetical protein
MELRAPEVLPESTAAAPAAAVLVKRVPVAVVVALVVVVVAVPVVAVTVTVDAVAAAVAASGTSSRPSGSRMAEPMMSKRVVTAAPVVAEAGISRGSGGWSAASMSSPQVEVAWVGTCGTVSQDQSGSNGTRDCRTETQVNWPRWAGELGCQKRQHVTTPSKESAASKCQQHRQQRRGGAGVRM